MAKNGKIGPLNAAPRRARDLWKFKNHFKVLPKVHHDIINRSDGVLAAFKLAFWSIYH